jgi:hypothetical protein
VKKEFVSEVQKSIGSIEAKSVTNPKAEVSKLNGKGRSGEPNFSGQTATADGRATEFFFSYKSVFLR